MIPKDIIWLTLKNILYRKTRSWLTILGIVIGIAAVVGLVGLGDAIQESIAIQLGDLGGDKLIITPGLAQQSFSRNANFKGEAKTTISTDLSGAEPLTEKEVESISKLPNILAVSPMVQRSYEVVFRGEYSSITTQFVKPAPMRVIEQPVLIQGRWLNDNDKFSCVIGFNIANEVFSHQILVGDLISVNGKNCRVIGVLKKEGGYTGKDDDVILNIGVVDSFVSDYNEELTYAYVRVKDTSLLNVTEEQITNLLLKLHHTVDKDFTILSFASIQESVSSITNLISAFLGGIAAISLLVGAIGISNTMFTSVLERTKEIGILKAIGAKERDILALFITEASIMSLIGGVVGLIIGTALAQGMILLLPKLFTMPSSTHLRLILNPLLLIGSLIISIVIGALSGFLPARKAARLNPIEAIWYE